MIVHDQMHDVRLFGWRKGALKISAIDILKENGQSLSKSKEIVDRCLEGKITIFNFDSLIDAQNFSMHLDEIGFLTEIIKTDTGELIFRSNTAEQGAAANP